MNEHATVDVYKRQMYIFALNLTCMEQINTIDKISAVYRNTAEEARQEPVSYTHLNIMGPTSPLRTISLKRKAIFIRPTAS